MWELWLRGVAYESVRNMRMIHDGRQRVHGNEEDGSARSLAQFSFNQRARVACTLEGMVGGTHIPDKQSREVLLKCRAQQQAPWLCHPSGHYKVLVIGLSMARYAST